MPKKKFSGKLVEVKVIAPEGLYIAGYGSREKGDTFTIPYSVAKEIERDNPDKISIPKETEPAKKDKVE